MRFQPSNINLLISCATAIATLVFAPVVCYADLQDEMVVDWEVRHGPDKRKSTASTGAYLPGKDTALIAGHTGELGEAGGNWWIWQVSLETGRITELVQKKFPPDFTPSVTTVESMATSANAAYLSGDFDTDSTEVIKVSLAGKITKRIPAFGGNASLFKGDRSQTIRDLIVREDGHLLVVGSNKLVVTNSQLKVVARQEVDLENVMSLVNGAGRNGLPPVATAMVGKPDNWFADGGTVNVALGEIKHKGGLKFNVEFNGRWPSVSGFGKGKVCVVYDRSIQAATDIWATAFDRTYQKIWEQRVVQIPGERNTGFEVTSDQEGKVYVAGVVDGRLNFSVFNARGERLVAIKEEVEGVQWGDPVLFGVKRGAVLVINVEYREKSMRKPIIRLLRVK